MRISLQRLLHFLPWLLFMPSCMVDRSHKEQYLQKSLDKSTWVLTCVNDQSRTDTIFFSFGYSDTNEEMNLLDIHSGSLKEIAQFSLSKRKIRFDFENEFYSLSYADTKSKSRKYVLVFKKDTLKFKRPANVNRRVKISRL